MLDWVVFPCEKALGCSCRSKRSKRPEYRVEARLPCCSLDALGVKSSPSPRSETEAALGLSQRRALILVLVLSFAVCAGIWVTVALLSVAGGDDLG